MKFSTLTTKLKMRLKKALVVTATVLTAVAGANFTALPANAALAYDFTSWTFTPCGQTGRTGPSLEMCQTAYADSAFEADSNLFTVDAFGQQFWKAPVTGVYKVEIAGAAGGGTNGGRGNVFQVQLSFSSSQFTCFSIGQKGVADTMSADSGGGGGTTYLTSNTSPTGNPCAPDNLAAGGGGGGGNTPGLDASADFAWGATLQYARGTAGTGRGAGIGGNASNPMDGATGGPLTGASGRSASATVNSNGTYMGGVAVTGTQGRSDILRGGTFGLGKGGDGGFPDGGASCDCVPGGGGGGGGGYAGGGGGYNADGTGGGGGGGGSYNQSTTSAYNLGGINTGDGYIKISYEGATTNVNDKPNLTLASPYAVGATATVSPVSLPNLGVGATISWKWQTTTSTNANPWGAPSTITDIPGATGTSLVVPESAGGKYLRAVQIVTNTDGSVMYYGSGYWPYAVVSTHSITGTPPSGMTSANYNYQMSLAGNTNAPSLLTGWALDTGALPNGLSITAGGVISGTPTTLGTFNFTLRHTNPYETAYSQPLSIIIGSASTWVNVTPPLPSLETPYSYQFVANPPSGETITSYQKVVGTIPTGLTLDSATGILSGAVTSTSAWSFTIRAYNSSGGWVDSSSIGMNIASKSVQASISYSTSGTVTWNPANPNTGTYTWTQGAAKTGVYKLTNASPNTCTITSGFTSSPTTVVAKRAGFCSIVVKGEANATYASTSTTMNWNVAAMAQAPITVAKTAGTLEWAFNSAPVFTVTASGGSGTGAITYSTTNPAYCTVDPVTGVVQYIIFGPCYVVASKAADADYAFLSSASTSFPSVPIPQSGNSPVVVTGAPSTLAYLGTATVSATGGDVAPGAKAAYSFQSVNTKYCTVGAGTGVITTVNAGTCQIQARVNATGATAVSAWGPITSIAISGNAQETLTASGSGTFVAGGNGKVTVTLAGGTGTGGWTWATDASVAAICTGSGVTASALITMKGAGECLINVTKSAQGGYYDQTQQFSITIAKANQAVTTSFSPTTITYNPTTAATFTITGSGGSSTGGYIHAIDSSSAAICSVTNNVVTVLGAGLCLVNTYRAGDSNYLDSPLYPRGMNIAKASQTTAVTVTANRSSISSSDVDPLVVTAAGGNGTGVYIYATSTTTYCSVDSSTGVVTGKALGTCTVTATRAGDSNFLISSASSGVNISVTKLGQATFTASSTVTTTTFGAATFTVSAVGGSGTGAITYAANNITYCTVNSTTGVVTVGSPGSCVITATKAGDSNYMPASSSVTITINKANQATFTANASPSSGTYGGTSIQVSGSGGSGTGALSWSSADTSICTVGNTGQVSVQNAGSCVITVTRSGGTNYNDASASVTITIAKANQATFTATASATSGAYLDGVSYSVSASGGTGAGAVSYSSNSPSVCSVDSATGAVTILTAGTCSISATKAGSANYNDSTKTVTITIAKGTQPALVATVNDAAPAYTDSPKATVQVSYSGSSSTGAVTYSTSTAAVCSVDSTGLVTDIIKGKCIVTVSVAADANYQSASASVTIRFGKVDQASVSVSSTKTSVVYGAGSAITVSLTGGSGTGAISFSTASSNCEVGASTGVVTYTDGGTCVVIATKAGDIDYAEASKSVTITVTKATQATFTASSSPSNTTFGSPTTVTISGTGGSGTGAVSYASTTSGVCSVDASTGVITIVTAGTCSITVTKAADTNYNVVTASTSVVIAKATQSTLTLTPANSSVVFGGGQSANVIVSGGSGTGAVSYASNSTGICSVNASTGAVTILTAGTCSITVTKATSTNYNVATATASITVAKGAQATINITGNQSLTHSTSNPTSQLSVTGGSGNGTVSYAVDASSNGICVVSAGGLVTGLHAGTCVINFTKAGDANYNAGTASYTITIAKATQANLSVTGSANLTYSATNAVTTQLNVSGGSSSGAVAFSVDSGSSTVCSVSSNGLVTVLTAGTCVIAITKAGDSDYLVRTSSFTVNIAKVTQATMIVRTAAELTFDPNTPATTTVALTAGGSGTGSVSFSTSSTACSVVGNVVTALNAGTCVISATKAADTNFNVATTSYTVIITKALQTALVATPSRTTLKFGDQSNNSATVTLAGGSGTGSTTWFVDPTTTGVCSVNFSATPAVVTALSGGTCKVNITKAGDSGFEPASTSVTFTIQKNTQASLTVSSTKTAAKKGETATLSATGGSSSGNISYSVVTGATACSISGSTITFIGAGTCSIKATRAGDANFDAVDSATIELSATKAEQTQLIVAQSAGLLPNVAIGGKTDTSWAISGGNGNGALSVSAVTGCYATITGSTLNVAAGNVAGNCSIDVEKAESNDYNATSYRVSLQVFNLPNAAAIGTPVLNMNSSPDGVGVDVPFIPSSTGTFVAPVTGYQLQTKSGSNWVNADNGFATGPTANKVSISVTPWTSIFVRVAAVSGYESTNGASRIWSTYGGATAQAFSVPGIITSLSLTTISAKSPETITVTGAGYSKATTPTVEFTAASPIFQINGVKTATITLPATVKSATQLTFKYPGTLLPSGVKTLASSVKVNGSTAMKSNGAPMTLTQEEDSLDLGLDLAGGRFAPKVSTVFAGSFTWAFSTAKGAKIFLVPTCTTYKTVKGIKTCTKTVMKDSASCSITQVFPLNKSGLRRMISFKVPCQLNMTGKLAILAATPIDIVAKYTFTRTYPKTNLAYVLVKGKKTKPLALTKATYVYRLGNKQLIRK